MKKGISITLVICLCLSMLSSFGSLTTVTAATEYEEISMATGDVYYGDFVWGSWYFDWNVDKTKKLVNGHLQSEGSNSPLTTEEVYTHGDLVMIGLDREESFKKIQFKAKENGQMPYKFKLEYANTALSSPPDVPQAKTTIGEYTDYSMEGDTITVELEETITARSIWLQALTDGADQEPGAAPWSVSEIHLFKENFNTVPNAPIDMTEVDRQENSLSFKWSTLNNNYSSFDIYRSDNEHGEYVRIGSTTGAYSFEDNELLQDVTYYYKVKTINPIGESEFSSVLSMKTKLAVAELAIAEADGLITLSWSEEEHASSYEIYRATGKYSSYSLYAHTETTTFTDDVTGEKYRYYYKVRFVKENGDRSDFSEDVSLEGKLFGDTMTIYSPTDDHAIINSMTAETAKKMKPMALAEFSTDRYAYLFKPGNYNINPIDVGYYTSVYGLGATPLETIVPKIQVAASEYNSLTNFWRSVENIGMDAGDPESEVMWAASQAAPARRLYVNGKLQFDDNQKHASGGFLADSFVTGQTGSYSQQQYFLRNNTFTSSWFGGVWNMLFVGVDHAPPESTDWHTTSYASYTVEDQTPIVREKPFLYMNQISGEYDVFVPSIRENTSGVSWSDGNPGAGISISINDFYVARAAVDTADTINAALDQGKHLLLTPGIYKIDKPIKVNRANTVVLGIGMTTIIPTSGNDAMQIADVGGVTVAGLLIDAGEAGSEHLLQVGPEGSSADHSSNPTLLADVFTRIGGAVDGKAEVSVEINSNDVIGDHFWLWRADHGMHANSTGWTKNVAKNGVIVNGDDVTIYGLFVEHFQEYQTVWNGENGKTFFYQSEIPYDPPSQADYMSHNGTVKGYASYKVSDHVKSHYAVALGIYDVFVKNPEWVELENAMEVPDGSTVKHAAIVSLGANGGTNHIINGLGEGVQKGEAKKSGIKLYNVERVPETRTAAYDGLAGHLTLSGKNYDFSALNWSKMIFKGSNNSLVLDASMVANVHITWNTMTISLNDNAKKQVADLFNYENGSIENGVALSEDYMTGASETILVLDVSGLTPEGPSPNHGGGNNNTSSPHTNSHMEAAAVMINGNTINAGMATTDTINGKQMTTIVLNEEVISEQLNAGEAGITFSIPVISDSAVIAGQLSAQLVKQMEQKQAIIEIRTEHAAFTLPAIRINIDNILARFNKDTAPQDIIVRLEIAVPSTDMIHMVEHAAKNGAFKLLAPPLDFNVFASYGDHTEEISTFNQYVERSFLIPDEIDPKQISTGVVVEKNGTVRHIPTKLVTINGKLFAIMNSLTNSTYVLVSSPVAFADTEKHWAKESINNMGARMIMNGDGANQYYPNLSITRAEFVALLVRALGIKQLSETPVFTDVDVTDWFSTVVQSAHEYSLISGFSDSSFRPNELVTREQAMIMMSKAMTLTGLKPKSPAANDSEVLQPFIDQGEISTWAKTSFIDSLEAGLITGRSATILAPKGFITRAETAVLIERLLQRSHLI
ncbi:S-layer homology domain-containing protein [Paenibacillus sinopodophylli]|uniref:S-layer homology domain-containing protein n=1 Tax=Paenibacillus sinopodophylli TaxID=1837342 RepID=UPI001485C3DF|nr:S-layer homology domain-containing protein [Paenibacillus sinopodophylli]